MISLAKLRAIEPEFAKLSDEELEAIRADLYSLAEFTFDVWKERSGLKSSHLVDHREEP